MNTDVGRLYDTIAADYERGADRGVFAGTRALTVKQLAMHSREASVSRILDLALGTGESLLAVRDLFPRASLLGIDLSENMIALARRKLDVTAIHDDARSVGRHVEPGSIDLLLMHFLLGAVDPDLVLGEARTCLRADGLFSVATSTYESFQKLNLLSRSFMPEEMVRAFHTPESADATAALLERTGFEVLDLRVHKQTVVFSDFEALYDFGMGSGLFTQILSALSEEQLGLMRAATEFFPLEDEFQGTAVLARRR
jgi:ubiquinone/menaquinone biosynthesis C-methylase UbiE